MTDNLDPNQKALLYSELVAQAQRLGDRHLLLMARRRLGSISEHHDWDGHRHNVVPFPTLDPDQTEPPIKPPCIWMILLQSAMIPVGMAIILFAFIQASIHIYSGPMG